MKKSKEETAQTRARIVRSASARFRKNGIAATGLADVMEHAGLTHGGFYRHFESKDALVREAIDRSSQEVIERLTRGSDGHIETLIRCYLSSVHRDDREAGCPLAGLGSEMAQADGDARDVATECTSRFIELITEKLGNLSPAEAKKRAMSIASTLVGALMLSRAVSDPKLSNDLLKSAIQGAVSVGERRGN